MQHFLLRKFILPQHSHAITNPIFVRRTQKEHPVKYSLDTQADRVGHSPLHLSHLSSNCTSLILWHCDFDLLANITFDEHHHQPTLVLFFFSQTQQCRRSLPSSHFTESFCLLRKEMLRECYQDVNYNFSKKSIQALSLNNKTKKNRRLIQDTFLQPHSHLIHALSDLFRMNSNGSYFVNYYAFVNRSYPKEKTRSSKDEYSTGSNDHVRSIYLFRS